MKTTTTLWTCDNPACGHTVRMDTELNPNGWLLFDTADLWFTLGNADRQTGIHTASKHYCSALCCKHDFSRLLEAALKGTPA